MTWYKGGTPGNSGLYPRAKQSFLSQSPSIDMDTDVIKISMGRTSAYTVDDADQFKSSATTVVDADSALSGRTVTSGVFDASVDALFTAVTAGAALDFALIWDDTAGASTTDPLICYVNMGTGIVPNGGNITLQFDNTASRIFAL